MRVLNMTKTRWNPIWVLIFVWDEMRMWDRSLTNVSATGISRGGDKARAASVVARAHMRLW